MVKKVNKIFQPMIVNLKQIDLTVNCRVFLYPIVKVQVTRMGTLNKETTPRSDSEAIPNIHIVPFNRVGEINEEISVWGKSSATYKTLPPDPSMIGIGCSPKPGIEFRKKSLNLSTGKRLLATHRTNHNSTARAPRSHACRL
jgi:hypothetical protein